MASTANFFDCPGLLLALSVLDTRVRDTSVLTRVILVQGLHHTHILLVPLPHAIFSEMYLIPPPLLPPKLPAEFLKLRDDPGALYASEARLEEIRCTLDAEFSTIAAKEAHLHYILAHLSSVKQNFNNAIEHIRNLSIQRAALHVQLVREEEYKFSTPHKRRRDLSDDLDDDKAASTSSGSSPDRFFRSNIRQCIRRVGPTELTPIQPCLPDVSKPHIFAVKWCLYLILDRAAPESQP